MKADKEIKIGESRYLLKCLPTRKGERTFLRIAKMFLPTASFISPSDAKKQILSALDSPDFFDKVLSGLADRLSPDEIMDIMEIVLEPVQLVVGEQGKESLADLKPQLDSHFAGEYENLHKLFFATLSHNYESFFLNLSGVVAMIPIISRLLVPKNPTTQA